MRAANRWSSSAAATPPARRRCSSPRRSPCRLLIRGGDLGKSMSRYLVDQVERNPSIEVCPHTEVVELHGEHELEAVTVGRQPHRGAVASRLEGDCSSSSAPRLTPSGSTASWPPTRTGSCSPAATLEERPGRVRRRAAAVPRDQPPRHLRRRRRPLRLDQAGRLGGGGGVDGGSAHPPAAGGAVMGGPVPEGLARTSSQRAVGLLSSSRAISSRISRCSASFIFQPLFSQLPQRRSFERAVLARHPPLRREILRVDRILPEPEHESGQRRYYESVIGKLAFVGVAHSRDSASTR